MAGKGGTGGAEQYLGVCLPSILKQGAVGHTHARLPPEYPAYS